MYTQKCKCGKTMILRSGKFGKFYGCTGFPKCHNTIKYIPEKNPEIKSEIKQSVNDFIASKYQEAIFDFINKRTENLLIQAVAGSGKSTTLVKIVELLNKNSNIIFLAFNVEIVKSLSGKIPSYAMVKTFHGLGFGNIRKVYPKIKVNENKLFDLLKIYRENNPEKNDEIKLNQNVIIRLVNLIKDCLLDCSMESIAFLTDKYNLTLNSDTLTILESVNYLFVNSIQDKTQIDFSDMIYFPAMGIVPCEKFDFILCDESQDLNPGQLALIDFSTKNNTRLIFVGDRNQSIYAFRGADIESMDKIKVKFNCVELPLSICYRCPNKTIQFINQKFPEINFEGRLNNIEGIWESINQDNFYRNITDESLALCRNNAPLIKPAYRLLSEGRKVIIKGKDIGINLISLIEKIAQKYKAENLNDFLESLSDYQNKESEKLTRLNQTRKLETLLDSIECIQNFSEDSDTISEIIEKIDRIFSDYSTSGITFSSIHKAKGLESDVVYLINPGLMPSKQAKTEDELSQEYNLQYVAYTRNKKEFYEVELK